MGSSSSTEQRGNPILYTSVGYTIQPYWLIIVELIFIQSLQRLYNKFTCLRKPKDRSWYIPLEILVLEEKIGDQ